MTKKNYYEANKASILKQQKEYREANQEKVAAVVADWKRRHEGHTYLDKKNGYVLYIGYEHPIANPSGITHEHRIVLWEKLEGQDAPCNWCGRQLYWNTNGNAPESLCVDHLNNEKADNRPENLVPTCRPCNVTRPGGRKTPVNAVTGQCSLDFCDRDAESRLGEWADEYAGSLMCKTHYQQVWNGRTPTEIRPKKSDARITEDGRECTACGEFMSYDRFYPTSNGRGYRANCRECMIASAIQNRQRRDAA